MTRAFRIKVRHPGTPTATGPSERERFWNALAIRVGERSPRLTWHIMAREAEGDSDDRKQSGEMYHELERELERYFPHRLLQVIWESRGDGGLGLELKFALFNIEYGSLELILGALGIEKTVAIYGIALPAVVSMIEASVPEALRKTLDLPPDVGFDVTMSDVDAVPPSSPVAEARENTPDAPASRTAAISRALSLLNVSYLGPILLGVIVLYFAGSAALDAMKAATTERTILMQQYAELTKQQLITVSDERKEIARLLGAFLHEAVTSNQVLVDSLRKIATEEHGQSLEILRAPKGRDAEAGSQPAAPVGEPVLRSRP
jgi:hypothetical protein